jgi:hypothetical protein
VPKLKEANGLKIQKVTESSYQLSDREPATVAEQGQPAANDTRYHAVVVDDYWERIATDTTRLEEALGISDKAFCEAIVRQVYVLAQEEGDETDCNFVFSFIEDAKPINKAHLMLLVQMSICHLAVMRQGQILLMSAKFEPPDDFGMYSISETLRRNHQIKIDDQPVCEFGTRIVNKLMHTYVTQLEASTRYRLMSQADTTRMIKNDAANNGSGRKTRLPNGRRRSAVRLSGKTAQATQLNGHAKTNGQVSS